jgi:CHAT domain-containing protein
LAAAEELERFRAAVSDWPENRFTADQAKAYIAAVAWLLSVGRLPGDSPPVATALHLAVRENVQKRRTTLAATVYGQMQQEGRLHEVAVAGLGELKWLCQNTSENPVSQAALAAVVMDACCRIDDWLGVEDIARLLPGVERAAQGLPDTWRVATGMLVAQCRFYHALKFGQPDRAACFLETAEDCERGLGPTPMAADLKAGLLLARSAMALANEDFTNVETIATTGQQELEAIGVPAAKLHAYADRLHAARGLALVMQGRLAEADEILAKEATGDIGLGTLVQRSWIAHALGHTDHFQKLVGELEQASASCQDPILLAGVASLQLQIALAAKTEDDAARAERTKRLEGVQERLLGVCESMRKTVAALPCRLGGIGFFHFEPLQQLLADLVAVQRALQPNAAGDRLAMQTVLRAQALGSLARSLSARNGARADVADLATVQNSLPAHAIALVYLPSRFRSSLLMLSRDDVAHVSLPPRTEFDEVAWRATGALLQLGGANADPELTGDLQLLTAQLLPKEVLDRIAPHNHLIVVASGALANLPFEALPLADGSCLGERYAVSNVASLPLRTLLQPAPSNGGPLRVLLVGNLSPAAAGRADLGLKDVPLEVAAPWMAPLQAPFDRPSSLIDAAATEAALRAQPLGDYDVVHILAHGARDVRREFAFSIALGGKVGGEPDQDGLLWPEDVLGMQARGLVILSACRVGRAPRRGGEDHSGNLGGAFLHAGASAVVQSRGAIRLRETCDLMAAFHDQLAKRTGWAEALKTARASLAKRSIGVRLRAAQMQLQGWSR